MKDEIKKYEKLLVFTDGGSRGNPGLSAFGFFITDKNNVPIYGLGKCIGVATNNVAEYTAILEALGWIVKNKEILRENATIHFYLDSQLAYSQLVGLYKIKNVTLAQILFEIHGEEREIDHQIFYSHIPREKNKEADRLVNRALDNPPQVTYN